MSSNTCRCIMCIEREQALISSPTNISTTYPIKSTYVAGNGPNSVVKLKPVGKLRVEVENKL